MLKIRREKAEKLLKELYPVGTRVRLVKMDDKYTKIPIGTEGTVTGIDGICSLMVDWDYPSSLNVLFEEDEVEIVSKILYQLVETIEGSDGFRDFNIVYSNYDEDDVISKLKECVEKDVYGMFAANGLEEDEERHVKSKYDYGFHEFEVRKTVISC